MVSLTKRMTIHRMLRLAFSETDQQALHYERYHHPHPRVQQRMEALWLKSQGFRYHQIAQLCAISANTLRSYLKLYHTGGVEALKQLNFHCPQSLLRRIGTPLKRRSGRIRRRRSTKRSRCSQP